MPISTDESDVSGYVADNAGAVRVRSRLLGDKSIVEVRADAKAPWAKAADEHGRFRGQLKATGVRPKFAEKLADQGIRLGPEVFSPEGAERKAVSRL